jgi:endonuclease/exonuclease/phosphatase family metal-dependent hydrolase
MKTDLKAIIFATLLATGCGESTIVPPPEPESETEIQELNYGTPETLEVLTWNLQTFPKHEDTIPYLSQIIPNLDIDIIALQEIRSSFQTLLDNLPNYQGFKSNSASYDYDLAFLYNPETITINNSYEIFQNNWYAFPRPPLILEIEYDSTQITIINNHFKCCGGEDNEERRTQASNLLEDYIEENLSEKNVIVLGDLNDELGFFQNFVNSPLEYKFTDYEISLDQTQWSYPRYPSHIDHILITDELFQNEQETKTLKIEDLLTNSWSEYYTTLSDHRPVVIKLDFSN